MGSARAQVPTVTTSCTCSVHASILRKRSSACSTRTRGRARRAASRASPRHGAGDVRRIKVGFVLHVMNVAGAEVLVAETIRRLGARIAPVIFCIDEVGALGHRMREEGVDVVAFDRRPGLDLRVAWRMAAEISARALDVIHAHQYTPFFYGSIAARLSRVRPRVIFTEHGRHFPDVVSPKRWIVNRMVFDRLADNVNAVCEFSARALRDKDGFARRTIEVIPNGVDLPRYAPVDRAATRAALGLDQTRRYVATIARFHPVKDHRTLLN